MFETYVSVDGGMTDNIRPSLYQARYECAIVNKMRIGNKSKELLQASVVKVGIIPTTDVDIKGIEHKYILVIASTGAYRLFDVI